MHTIHPSLKTLASIAFLATISAATLANTSASTNSSGEKAYIIPYINPYTDPPHALGIPNPSTKPIFKYDFNIIFKDGQCSESQEATILETMTYIAALSDRAQLWEADVLHDWQPELEYWFGEEPETQDAWIKNNFLRVSTAIKDRKDGWINTWVYVGCDYPWDNPGIRCTPTNHIFNFLNDDGYWNRWDKIIWNFCPGFFRAPSIVDQIESTLYNPRKNPHFMENYLNTREQWLFPALLSIRSIGINKFTLSWNARTQSPYTCWTTATFYELEETLINYMSYFYTALAITIPESFNWNARPLVSGEASGPEAWFNMNNSNGTFPPPPPPSSLVAAQNSAGTQTYVLEGATPASSDVAPFTTLGSITFATVTDTAHTSTENCFMLPPSKCDCGTATAALTVKGSTTGCAVGNSFVTINQFPTPTVSKSTTSTPVVISPKPTPTRAFEIMYKAGSVIGAPDLTINDWSVYSHAPGQATKINACDGGFWWPSASYSGFPTALGTFNGDVNSEYSGCMYRGPKTAAGSVSCPGMSTWTACSAAPVSTQLCDNGDGFDDFSAQVKCNF